MYPTKTDFDNAVKQHWGSRTCLVAQTMKRLGIPTEAAESDTVEAFASTHNLEYLMHVFDRRFNNPGDEKTSPELIAMREELPDESPKEV